MFQQTALFLAFAFGICADEDPDYDLNRGIQDKCLAKANCNRKAMT